MIGHACFGVVYVSVSLYVDCSFVCQQASHQLLSAYLSWDKFGDMFVYSFYLSSNWMDERRQQQRRKKVMVVLITITLIKTTNCYKLAKQFSFNWVSVSTGNFTYRLRLGYFAVQLSWRTPECVQIRFTCKVQSSVIYRTLEALMWWFTIFAMSLKRRPCRFNQSIPDISTNFWLTIWTRVGILSVL